MQMGIDFCVKLYYNIFIVSTWQSVVLLALHKGETMNQIFISYRRIGGDAIAYLLHSRLTAMGYKVFYDIESLHQGRFDDNIFKSIDECTDVLVILSPNALDRCQNQDDWVRAEIAYAIWQGKNIIPIMLDGFTWPESLPQDIEKLPMFNGISLSFRYFDIVLEKIVSHFISNKTEQIATADNKKHVLVWADVNSAVVDKIVKRLQLGEDYTFEQLTDPLNILSKNLKHIDTIVLIVTDCTKFSNNEVAKDRINQTLVDYVRHGGRLICTHDAIYRRTRNDLLQEMYGCKISYFKSAEGVTYVKTDDCKDNGLFADLEDSFVLHDDEICWGDVAYDVEVHFQTEDGVPLVFSREYGDGVCIYLHSGDYKFNPPPSIGKPEKPFVDLLRASIKFEY